VSPINSLIVEPATGFELPIVTIRAGRFTVFRRRASTSGLDLDLDPPAIYVEWIVILGS
jgi:hypothetical protein